MWEESRSFEESCIQVAAGQVGAGKGKVGPRRDLYRDFRTSDQDYRGIMALDAWKSHVHQGLEAPDSISGNIELQHSVQSTDST